MNYFAAAMLLLYVLAITFRIADIRELMTTTAFLGPDPGGPVWRWTADPRK